MRAACRNMEFFAKMTAISPRDRANAIRLLAIDAVEAAKSGHPGMPMGMADIAESLWRNAFRHNPGNPNWLNRDRFVLSNGHGSMLQYAVLHLTGYDLPLAEIKRFRQLHSRTPGHPELGVTPGVETTTGPLGQGLANAVGMALAERMLAAEFNRPGHEVINHRTFVFAGDGCLMEGISHEACSLAGTWGLEKLVVFYDDNGISIDGHVKDWFSDDTVKRFEAYGFRVISDVDGHDAAALDAAIAEALTPCGKPTLICCRTIIGWGAPTKAGTDGVHGAALGGSEYTGARANLGGGNEAFVIADDVRAAWDQRAQGAAQEAAWDKKFAAYKTAHPDLAAELLRRLAGDLPSGFKPAADAWIDACEAASESVATRKSSQIAVAKLAALLPEFLGGSADLTGSNFTDWPGCVKVGATGAGNYIHYGVREFAMAAIMNGIALHGGFIPFGGTFLVFSDYERNAIRLAALMRTRVIHVLTHDSIGVGEDGPTHQPIEHVQSLRLIPGLDVWRPADTLETAIAWRHAVERKNGPSALILSRQNLPQYPQAAPRADKAARGGYVLSDCATIPEIVLIATGSEIGVAMDAQKLLAEKGKQVRVVSMPCVEVFDRQDTEYKNTVLPDAGFRVAIEVGVSDGWYRFVGREGLVIGIDRFGESAPGGELFKYFGFTGEAVAEKILASMG
jgi:transketolase